MKHKKRIFVNILIILSAIIIPPLALFLIWRLRREWIKRHKVLCALTVAWSIFWIISGISGVLNPSPDAPSSPKNVQSVKVNYPVVTKNETAKAALPFSKTSQNDDNLAKGKTQISQAGVDGEQTTTYEVKYQNGQEISRKQTTQEVTRQPVAEITLVGTYVAPAAAPQPAAQQPSAGQTYYCEDGTIATGDPHAAGRANSCYGHGGWVINHER